MAFRRINALTPARYNENSQFQPNIGLKDGLASGRKHNQPKQAFGELKNVLHNHESKFSNSIKKNIFQNFETPQKSEQKKNNIKYDLKPPLEDFDFPTIPELFKSTEEYWAEKIALTDAEFSRILAPENVRKHTITIEEVCEIIKNDCEEIGENTLDKLLEEELEQRLDEKNRCIEDYQFNLQDFDDIPVPKADFWSLDLLDFI